MKIAIIGSRNFINYELFCKAIDKFLKEWEINEQDIEEVISNGALGAAKLAEQWALDRCHNMKIFFPDVKNHGINASEIRNKLIINYSTHVIAFPSINGKGTQNSLKQARLSQKPVKALWFDVHEFIDEDKMSRKYFELKNISS